MGLFVNESGASFQGHTLILPSITIGNLPQLTIDLLLTKFFTPHTPPHTPPTPSTPSRSTLSLKRVGFFYDKCLMSAVGNDAYAHKREALAGKLSVNVEVYQDEAAKLTIVQQRAPVCTNCNSEYATKIYEWITASSFSNVILLTTSDAACAANPYLLNRMFYATTTHTHTPPLPQGLYWISFETLRSQLPNPDNDYLQSSSSSSPSPASLSLSPLVPERSFPFFLYNLCEKGGVPLLVMAMYTREGPQNISEASMMAGQLWCYLSLSWGEGKEKEGGEGGEGGRGEEWVMPVSWESLFVIGEEAPKTLY